MNQPLTTSPHSLGHVMHELERRWPWMAALGVLSVLLGCCALVLTVSATIASVLVIGVFMAIAGGMEIVMGVNSKTWSRFFLWIAAGLFYLAAGAVAIAQPILAAAVFTLMLGAGLVATGALRLWVASHMPHGRRALPVTASLVTLGLGLVIVFGWPGNSVVVLGLLLGIDLIFNGGNWIAFAMTLRRHAHRPSREGA
jgi:uncharacterized membrane protein HdeD (DUF308 family)